MEASDQIVKPHGGLYHRTRGFCHKRGIFEKKTGTDTFFRILVAKGFVVQQTALVARGSRARFGNELLALPAPPFLSVYFYSSLCSGVLCRVHHVLCRVLCRVVMCCAVRCAVPCRPFAFGLLLQNIVGKSWFHSFRVVKS